MHRLNLKILNMAIVSVLLLPALSRGDVTVVKEVVVTPKSVNVAANIGSVNIGEETFQNLMVWEETFSPGQKRKVEVLYQILIPLQETTVVRKQEEGNRKGIWPQEANNVPVEFLKTLDSGLYYFFDYYLTSGASWAGSIAFEDITLKFDPWWQDLEFHSTIKQGNLAWSNTTLYPGSPIIAYYQLRDVEPMENIYFAVRPGRNNEERQNNRYMGLPDSVGPSIE